MFSVCMSWRMKNRGVEDILITCVDGLTGSPEAISAVYPKTELQQCIIHQIRNSTKYVSYKDIKALMADLKKVYGAADEETALYELEQFAAKWDSKYPKISASWKAHWSELSTYFKYPQSVRMLIYTTNSIENFNRQLRKVSKNRSVFPNDDSLLKMLCLVRQTLQETGPADAGTKVRFILSLKYSLRQTAGVAEIHSHVKGKMNGCHSSRP